MGFAVTNNTIETTVIFILKKLDIKALKKSSLYSNIYYF